MLLTADADRCKRGGIHDGDQHPCPYNMEIHEDDRPCRCCALCEYECAQDI